jgi:uncharacterized protein YdcH (DUF465 family)
MSDYQVQKLKARHRELEDFILAEQASRTPNTVRIRELKKQKLAIRDELNRAIQEPPPHHEPRAS